ncbi:MAG: S9 family peptidase [Tannerella sp.]|jgi:dipeptidyl aminopeptidase/acylaminoacyl peptidase|nr:S9 family peptidase [Tannerella sp.]
MKNNLKLFAIASVLLFPTMLSAQGTIEDYKRALSLPEKYKNAVPNANITPRWIDDSRKFWYVRDTPDGEEYVVVDAEKKQRTTMPDTMKTRLLEERKNFQWRSDQYWAERDEQRTGDSIPSPDKKYMAFIKNSNVYVKDVATGKEKALSTDGAPGEYYSAYIQWSPDSRKVASLKIRPAEKQYFYMIESSPSDQLQPKLHKREYAKPGDALPFSVPCIFHVEDGKVVSPSTKLFTSQYDVDRLEWDKDSRNLMFDYNQRGHQVYRVLELSAETGVVRTVIEETSDTYVNYTRYYKYNLKSGKETIWMSERDNWNHLYLIDRSSGKVKQQITKGEWYVRDVIHVDEDKRQIYFSANGMVENEDPYFIRYYSIKMDGTGLTCLTPEEGMHTAWFSKDIRYFVDKWSKVDMAPKTVLRNAKDGKILMTLEECDLANLKEMGWIAPETFVAKGRDGKTDIWGVIFRPTNFDPDKKYPVLEYIYSGPGSAYTPKAFRALQYYHQIIAELGFIVVQCDGMTTSFRSKAFESVCYKNLKDAGFPDRIPWIKAAAEKYPYMDIERVGIFGGSAGGQEAMAAVLFHPEFYKAAYAGCGCHDNRMDKIWWNEQWMGYPVDSSYIACSNVENAHLLTRPLMLMVGELDDNVDPASTMQAVNALIKAKKEFELVVVPGINHTLGGEFGDRKRYDFFVKHLLNVTPPDWNVINTP